MWIFNIHTVIDSQGSANGSFLFIEDTFNCRKRKNLTGNQISTDLDL